MTHIFRSRWGEKKINSIRKFEKFNYCLRKAEFALSFLVKCRFGNPISNFLCFGLANRSLQSNSVTYKQCQLNLLDKEFWHRKFYIRTLKRQLENLCKALQLEINNIDFAHIFPLFLPNNGKTLTCTDFNNINLMLHTEQFHKHDPSTIIFNFSNHELSVSIKSILIKWFNFSLPPKKLNYKDYLVQYDLFYRNIQNLKFFHMKTWIL